MNEFLKYQHLEKLGTSEVEGIEYGECFVFPKLDGTNASLWWDGELRAGSRKRELTLEKDNAGFYEWAKEQKHLIDFFKANPSVRLYGEWLVPHALKTYRDSAWRKFYVFDMMEGDRYIHYDAYQSTLERFGLDYLPYIAKIKNGTYDQFVNQLKHNVFLIEDGKGEGEGIVVKRYDFVNKYGRITWAKLVTSEFKEKHAKVHGGHEVLGKTLVEEDISEKYVTSALVEKEFAKIENESGWKAQLIPRLLNTVYYSVVKEESWNFVKEFRNPSIDFNRLKHFVFCKVKSIKPELF